MPSTLPLSVQSNQLVSVGNAKALICTTWRKNGHYYSHSWSSIDINDCASCCTVRISLSIYLHKTQTFEKWMERSICRPRTQCIMSLSIRGGGTGHPSASALLPSPCLARPKLLHVRTCWWLLLCCSSFYVGLWCLSGSPALEIICICMHIVFIIHRNY